MTPVSRTSSGASSGVACRTSITRPRLAEEQLAGQDSDVRLVGEEPVDAGAQEGELLVDRLAVPGRVGAHLEVARQERVLRAERVRVQHEPGRVRVVDERGRGTQGAVRYRGMIWFLSGPMPSTNPDSSLSPAGVT